MSRGFILQPTYRVERGRPVVVLYGKLESGETFVVRDSRPVPHFYVARRDAEAARKAGVDRLLASDRVDLAGNVLMRVEVTLPSDTPPLRDRLLRAGVACLEADVRFAMRYLIDRGIRGSLEIEGGEPRRVRGQQVFEQPTLRPADWTPDLSILSLDLETDPAARNILSAALVGCGIEEVLLLSEPHVECPQGAIPVSSQRELIQELCRRIRSVDPDVITGWNINDFDFPVLMRRAEDAGVALRIGRGRGEVRRREGRNLRQATQVIVPGRVVLDGLLLLRGAAVRMESYSLDAVGREVLGEGKTLSGSGRPETILRWYHSDRQRLVDYNLRDAQLVLDILAELQLVELAIERSRLTGMPLDRVSSSIAAFDFLYLSRLHARGIVAPSVTAEEPAPMAGGHLLPSRPGLFRNVLTFDFASLYPSIIRTFQIDPLGFVPAPTRDQDLIVAPNGAAFRRDQGLLTEILDELFPRRAAAKERGDQVASQAIKILMNSFYGVLGTTVCRFYDPRLAEAITSFGRELLLWSKSFFEGHGLQVLYGDTDSLFVESGEDEPAQALRLGERLAAELNCELGRHVEEQWRVESRLQLELERLYLRLFLPAVRGGKEGAMKRYAGLALDGERERLHFVGLESVRRDWTELAREAQRQLFARLFRDRPVEEYLRTLVAEVRGGEHDQQLVYRKALRKDLDAYTSTTPPHVAAARKMSGRPGRLIEYVVTGAGPEPAGERESAIDYEHYVDKQLRPIAEPILSLLDLDFARVVGDDTQMDLF